MVLAASWPMTSCRTLPASVSYRASWLIHNVLPRDKARKMYIQVKSKQEIDGTAIGQCLYCQWLRLSSYEVTKSVFNDCRDSIDTDDSHLNDNNCEMSVFFSLNP